VAGTGGSFSYYELGEPLMVGDVLNENVGVGKIREYVYFTDTKSRLPEAHPDEPYYMGVHVNSAYYFYYEKQAVTTLNREFLHTVKTKADAYVIYADLCTLSDAELEKYHITFKKIPRDITKL
jgi:adenine-specific DNA-methyltransferase